MMAKTLIKTPQKKFISKEKLFIGWQEWCALPQLGIPAIKAKIDTGAKTSALHAFDITPTHKQGVPFVNFTLHPVQGNNALICQCEAQIIDQRAVMSSTGHIEHRYVIATAIHLGTQQWTIEVTLSNRDPLKFRMLLGREALNGRVLIDPHRSLCQGKITRAELHQLYS